MDKPTGIATPKRYLVNHQIYEYRKGVRQLSMMTLTTTESHQVVGVLMKASIDHYIQIVNAQKVNLFFGHPIAVKMVRKIAIKPLNLLSPEEDFMLGTLLGYDREAQCRRYLAKIGA